MKEEILIPKKGLIVRDPITKAPLPESGMPKPYNKYWRRRVNCGDAMIKPVPKKKEKGGHE